MHRCQSQTRECTLRLAFYFHLSDTTPFRPPPRRHYYRSHDRLLAPTSALPVVGEPIAGSPRQSPPPFKTDSGLH